MMLSTSLRRAVRTTTTNSSSIPFPAILPSVSAVASAKNSFVTATNRRQGAQHQRRYSSSKPPVPPNDGSHPIDTSSSSQTPAKGGVNNGNKSAGKSASDKAKDSHGRKASKSRQAPAPFLNLPSVPSTQDTPMQDIHLASFFSVHRPISVSTSVPPTTDAEAFNAIFAPKSVSRRGRANVINTLTSAVQSMEHAFHGQDDLRHAVTQASVSNAEPRIIHLDEVSEEDLHTSIAEFAKRLTPFQPPAAPEPYNEEKELAAAAEDQISDAMDAADQESTSPNVRTYSTVFTIRETAYADGQRTFETYVAPLVREQQEDMEAPSSTSQSGTSYIERTINNKMYTISVRRQRKLKMKKHKFKKLLRKTRTLRRKLDKA